MIVFEDNIVSLLKQIPNTMKHKIQLIKETKEDGQVVYFVNIDSTTKSAHFNFEEAVAKYKLLVSVYQPSTAEVLMETEI